MIEQGIATLLNADATLATLTGSTVYAVLVPEGATYPCVSYQVVGKLPEYDFAGQSTNQARVQFDSWGRDYAEAKTLQHALREALDGYQGQQGDTLIYGVLLQNEIDFYQPDSLMFRALSEYLFFYAEF